MEQSSESNLFELHIDHESSGYLGETAKWAKFISILGFIVIGLMVILAFSIGAIMTMFSSQMPGAAMGASAISSALATFMLLAFAVLYFFPVLYLYRFATRMKVAIGNNDQLQLAASFKSLKSCLRFIGILTIIVLSFYILMFVLGIIGAAFR